MSFRGISAAICVRQPVRASSAALAALFLVAFVLAAPGELAADPSLRYGGARFTKSVVTFKALREREVVLQQWDFTCGAAALATILRFQFRDPVTEREIVETLIPLTGKPIGTVLTDGFSLLDLKRFAQQRGLEARGYAGLGVEELQAFNRPAIVPVHLFDFHHFVVFRGAHADKVFIADPAVGNTTLDRAEFESAWQDGIGFFIVAEGQDVRAEGPRALGVTERELLFPSKLRTIEAINRTMIAPVNRALVTRVTRALAPPPDFPRFDPLGLVGSPTGASAAR